MSGETARARVISMAEYWDDHPQLTRREAERIFGLTRDVPDSAEVDSLKEDIQVLTRQVASLRKAMQQMAEQPKPPSRRPKGEY